MQSFPSFSQLGSLGRIQHTKFWEWFFGGRTHLKVIDRRDHGLVCRLEPTWGWFSACGFLVSSQLVLRGAAARVPQRIRWKLDLQWLSLCSHKVTSAMRVRPVKCKVGTWNLVSFSGDRQHQVSNLVGSEICLPHRGWLVKEDWKLQSDSLPISFISEKKNTSWLCSWHYSWMYSFKIYCDVLFAF